MGFLNDLIRNISSGTMNVSVVSFLRKISRKHSPESDGITSRLKGTRLPTTIKTTKIPTNLVNPSNDRLNFTSPLNMTIMSDPCGVNSTTRHRCKEREKKYQRQVGVYHSWCDIYTWNRILFTIL